MKLHPYLNFNGNCRSAFEFYEKNLGGKILATMTHSEAPPGLKVPPEWNSAILCPHDNRRHRTDGLRCSSGAAQANA